MIDLTEKDSQQLLEIVTNSGETLMRLAAWQQFNKTPYIDKRWQIEYIATYCDIDIIRHSAHRMLEECFKENEIEELAAVIQDDCHKTVEQVVTQLPTCSVQDATNVFLFRELAKLRIEINTLKGK